MDLRLAVFVVNDDDVIPREIFELEDAWDNFIEDVIPIVVTNCNKSNIKSAITKWNNINVMIIIGGHNWQIDDYPTYEAIHKIINKEVMDKNIPKKLNKMISDLEKKLKRYGAICGLRKQTLMINMYGMNYANAISLMQLFNDEIMQILYSIAEDEEIFNNDSSDDNNSENAFSSHCFSNEETIRRINMMIEMYEKGQSIIMNSLKDAMEVMNNSICEEEIFVNYVNTKNAHGRILAEDIISDLSVPSYKSSSKHGYAVLASDGQGVRKVLPTNHKIPLVSGTCMRVRSGAPIPKGATAVVTLDNINIIGSDDKSNRNEYFNSDDKEYQINVLITPTKYDNIRHKGYEIGKAQYVLEKYCRIGPAELGILTLCGINKIAVTEVPCAGLLSIGDELEEPGNILRSKHIYDGNRITLASLLKENDLNSVDFGISAYEMNAIIQNVQKALEKVDILVTMGRSNDNDMLKPILQKYFNATIHFGRVNMKPGKSTTFATCTFNKKKKYILCMSANPVTVPIVAHLLLLPFLKNMHRDPSSQSPIIMSTRLSSKHKLHSRPEYAWTTVEWKLRNTFPIIRYFNKKLKNQHMNILRYSSANALLSLPADISTFQKQKISVAFLQTKLFAS